MSTPDQPRPAHPQAVLTDTSMSAAEKEQYLEDWRLDLVERQRATEENMPSMTDNGNNAGDMLQLVNEALTELRDA